jgi:hypothetical protein
MKKLLSFALLFALITSNTHALMNLDQAKNAAPHLANMIITGRGVIAHHQPLINDAKKGNKEFTPDYVYTKILEAYQDKIKVTDLKTLPEHTYNLLQAVLNSAKTSVLMNQPKINMMGLAFKGYTPAVFGREVGGFLEISTGVKIKQTSMKYRNVYNKPTELEEEALKKFSKSNWKIGEEYSKVKDGYYWYIVPVYIKPACLSCHGDNKGDLDIAGRKKEGYKVGDLRGAISVRIPIE